MHKPICSASKHCDQACGQKYALTAIKTCMTKKATCNILLWLRNTKTTGNTNWQG